MADPAEISGKIIIRGATEHNLKNVSLELPRESLTVFTGVSGSGKSSLAFDTIYQEGQRRFLESLSAYARQFLGGFEKPRVESIEGLSPTISIDQKTVGRSPRSTVGTITEVHDHLRLLFARLGEPHCPACGTRVEPQSAERIVDRLLEAHAGRSALVLAPVVRGRKGEYRKLLEDLYRDGYSRVRIDGEIVRLGGELPALRRHEKHTIEVVCDRLELRREQRSRWTEAVEKALAIAEGVVGVALVEEAGTTPRGGASGGAGGLSAQRSGAGRAPARTAPPQPATVDQVFSSRFACPHCGISLPEMEPRLFSFNSPHGSCSSCNGLGETEQVDPDLLVVDPSLPFQKGGLAGMLSTGEFADEELDSDAFAALGKRFGFTSRSSWADLKPEARRAVLFGDGTFPGLVPALTVLAEVEGAQWILPFIRKRPCQDCGGARLRSEARAVKFRGQGIHELCALSVGALRAWISEVDLRGGDQLIGAPILKNIASRLDYLANVGLSYLSLDRRSDTLAGGEAQRLRLASQVGAGLQGVLFVLDEPSIGLHPRDNRALLGTLRTLRDQGNTVLVVEHDQATMELADHLVDVGPGAGPQGGQVVASGSYQDLLGAEGSITADYLSGRRSIEIPAERRKPGERWLELRGVTHNNLKGIDVKIPLGLFIVVTGVSGSGKSSLVNHVLRPALLAKLGRHTTQAGRHRALLGYQHVDKLVDIDQSPIGRTPRSNPATYVKVFDLIRTLYAQVPEARARGYNAGRFSFNKDGGRCLECQGAGVKTVQMQFLPAVEVTCEACGGARYNRETLEIHFRARSIYDVLEMPISEAAEFFRDHPKISRPLELLTRVGLGYMKLGQPSTTLSGGEAQRIKLAAELKRRDTGSTLYLLDEPTTGLHFEDIRCLVSALDDLVSRGNTVLVIEHSTDVMKVADWIIDLGPEAGEAGGRLVCAGTPEEVSRAQGSHTGEALREHLATGPRAVSKKARGSPSTRPEPRDILVRGARQHNLKSIDVRVPRGSLTVITGVSGSGKTSLAFDTIFAEGQRRYLESLSTYARRFLGRMQSAECDEVSGLQPAIAIDQKSASSNPRSTVATITEVHDYLRLLYARVGRPHCTECGEALTWTTPSRLAQDLAREHAGEKAMVLSPLPLPSAAGLRDNEIQREVEVLRSSLLKDGYTRVLVGGEELRLDEDGDASFRRILAAVKQSLVEVKDPNAPALQLVVDRVILGEKSQTRLAGSLEQAFERGKGRAAVAVGGGAPIPQTRVPACPRGHMTLAGELTPSHFSFSSLQGACPRCRGMGVEDRLKEDAIIGTPGAPLPAALRLSVVRFLERMRASALTLLRGFLDHLGIPAHLPFAEIVASDREAILRGCATRFPIHLQGGARVEVAWPGLIPQLEQWAREDTLATFAPEVLHLFEPAVCSQCKGGRLRPESLAVRIGGRNIQELTALTVIQAAELLRTLELTPREQVIARQVIHEIENRLTFLDEVGLGYLSLDRTAGTLSGGEAQRIRLASQLGNRLAGVLYVLDEPTVGLHPRDTRKLLQSLEGLRRLGNTVLLVEHDRETMRAAEWLIDIGPGAGTRGGQLLAQGAPADVMKERGSLTGKFLSGAEKVLPEGRKRRERSGELKLFGIQHNNLAALDVTFPLGTITAVTGVSGSGKSSLVLDVLSESVAASLEGRPPPDGRARRIANASSIRRLVVVDQRPIGRSPRSNPATYTGLWDLVRELYASTPAAKVRGFDESRFSFNTGEGRCPACEGQGALQVEMHFLSDVWVPCDQCKGKRFGRETLAILFKDRSVGDLLDLEVGEALQVFESQPRILRILQAMDSVGLGYLRLGQPGNTLSGGEAQRLKLATELVVRQGGGTLYILDEPTTGLHFEDVRRLIGVFDALVDGGNSLVVIEHHLDVIRAADWVLDLGPEAGAEGGKLVAEGPPEVIARCEASHTGRALRELE